jgi:hypothetical protein
MNLGIYVNALDNDDETSWASKVIDYGIENDKLKDASIFYDNIGFTPYQYTCGVFNSTDLWNFAGSLLVMHKDSLRTATKIINDIAIFYYYGWNDNPTTFELLDISNKQVNIICRNEQKQKEFYRITGITASIIKEAEELFEKMRQTS